MIFYNFQLLWKVLSTEFMKLSINQATLMKTPMDIFLKAVAKAGFKGVELRRDQVFSFLKRNSITDLKELLLSNNLNCITFNAIELFSLCSEKDFEDIKKYTEKLMKIGNQIGCDTIICVPSFSDDPYLDDSVIMKKTIERLKNLADIAQNYSFKLAFEPLGFPNCSVRKIDFALKIIEDDRLPEIGLVIDTFHFFIGEHSIHQLDTINVEKIWLIHMNDAIEKPFQQLKDSNRVLPCQGFFNLEIFIKKLKEIGYNGWISLELFNEDLWKEDPYQVAKKSIESLLHLL